MVLRKKSELICRGQNEHFGGKTDITCLVLVLKSSQCTGDKVDILVIKSEFICRRKNSCFEVKRR